MIMVEEQAALLVTRKMAAIDGEEDEAENAAAAVSGKTVVIIEDSKSWLTAVCTYSFGVLQCIVQMCKVVFASDCSQFSSAYVAGFRH
jgi:hypothetical protein